MEKLTLNQRLIREMANGGISDPKDQRVQTLSAVLRNPILRQPGSKRVVLPSTIAAVMQILSSGNAATTFCDAMTNTGIVGLGIGLTFPHLTIELNDLDRGRVALLNVVRHSHEELIALIEQSDPTPDDFFASRARHRIIDADSSITDEVQFAYEVIIINRLSRGGYGELGGLIGGKGTNDHLQRWKPKRIVAAIREMHRALNMITLRGDAITCSDYSDFLRDESIQRLIFVDPPYLRAGPKLYKHAFGTAQHVELSLALRRTQHDFVLTYDDRPEVWGLYDFATVLAYEYPSQRKERQRETFIVPRTLDREMHSYQSTMPTYRDLEPIVMSPRLNRTATNQNGVNPWTGADLAPINRAMSVVPTLRFTSTQKLAARVETESVRDVVLGLTMHDVVGVQEDVRMAVMTSNDLAATINRVRTRLD